MSENAQRPRMAFIHIPRTGGITFREILKRTYPDAFFYCEDPDAAVIESQLEDWGCLELHFHTVDGQFAYVHQALVRPEHRRVLRGATVYTLFRDPVDHYLSMYHWVHYRRAEAGEVYGKVNQAFPETLDQFIASAGGNHAVAALLGRFQRPSRNDITPSDLEEARELIDELDMVVGVLERLSEFVDTFRRHTGSTVRLEEVGVLNRNPRRTRRKVPNDIAERIREVNSLDVALYEFVCSRVDRQTTSPQAPVPLEG